ncbi:MAG: alpha/beta hydrolase [Actinomycetota bacterium]|nr:alpha/beta hydrolase [Actinomycetota bacterium]
MTAPQTSATQRHRTSVFRAVVGLLWVVVAGYVLITKAGTLLAGHPAYPTLLIATTVVGLILVVTGVRPARPRAGRGGAGLVIGRVLGVVGTVLLLGGIVYLIPLPATDPVSAMQSTSAVTVASSPTRIVLTPAGGTTPRAGLVFQPGAKVDPRAYVALLKPVAEAGYLVVIVKQPFDIGFLSIGDPGNVIAANPGITRWSVAGHSLGGVAAGSYAEQQKPLVRGLLFWASYPLGSLAARTDLVVTSVSGTNDGLSTPADIEASRAKLPPSATFVAVEGGVHAFFGDYGEQPGDGAPSVSREVAQQQIIAATVAFMAKVAAA